MKINFLFPEVKVFWGAINSLTLMGYGLSVLPVQIKYLSAYESGVWFGNYSLYSIVSLVFIGGCSPAVIRMSSYIHSGNELRQSREAKTQAIFSLIETIDSDKFAASCKFLFLPIAFFGFLAILSLGLLFISYSATPGRQCVGSGDLFGVLALALGSFLLIRAGGLSSVLQGGHGQIVCFKVMSLSRIIGAIFTILSLLMGMASASLGFGILIMGIVQYFSFSIIYKRFYLNANYNVDDLGAVISLIWPSTWRFLIVMAGAWMISCSGPIVIGILIGLKEGGEYGLTLQVFQAISALSGVWISSAVPQMNKLYFEGKMIELKELYSKRRLSALLSFALCSMVVIFISGPMLNYIEATFRVFDLPLLLIFAFVMLLEFNHGMISAPLIMATNIVPFARGAFYSGVLIVSLTFLVCGVFRIGVWGAVVVQLFVQASYNNWKWPFVVRQIFSGKYYCSQGRKQFQ